MSIEIRKIQVPGYVAGGKPTCCYQCGELQCVMLGTRKFGMIDVCLFLDQDIDRDDAGYLRPVPGCPVWGGA